MAREIIKTSFAGGELTPSLSGRVDLAKYQVGAAVMRNFFVDYRGGASSRPGTSHVGPSRTYASGVKPRLIPFIFNADEAYVLEMHGQTMRVIFRGQYVTEAPRAITAVARGPITTITSAGHGYVADQYVQINNALGCARPNGISGLNTRFFRVGSATANTFTIQDPLTFADINSSSWSTYGGGGSAARVYEVIIPWAFSDLQKLNFAQSADVLTVVHPDFPAYEIRRFGQTNWQIVQQTYGAAVSAPTSYEGVAVNNNGSQPQYFYAYVITAVDQAGRESVPTPPTLLTNRALDQNSNPNVVNRITWSAVAGAFKYRIYKATPVPLGQQGGGPYIYGLIGNSYDTSFVDVNFAPEFDQGPPQGRNPFLDKALASCTIVTSGQGYVSPYLVLADASGSGGVVALGSDLSAGASPYGELSVANIVAGGTNYTAPTGTVLDAAPPGAGLVLGFTGAWVPNPLGTGFVPAPGSIFVANKGANYHAPSYNNFVRARAGNQAGSNVLLIDIPTVLFGAVQAISWANGDITPTPTTGLSSTGGTDTLTFEIIGSDVSASGATVSLALGGTTNPSCVAYFEQRLVFAGSRARPATFWMSRPGQFTNFDVSDPTQDDDAITASLYAQEVNLIHALVPVTSGLMALTSGGAYLITGGANDAAVTPSSIKAPPQAFSGAQEALQPLRIGDNVLYAQARGSAVRDLAFNFYSNSFTGSDISVLSSHLLQGRQIIQWAHAEEPNKLVWAVRDDGVMLSLTYLKEQEVYGWARHDTYGEYLSVCSIPEGREDAVYVAVTRWRPDIGFRTHIERMVSRDLRANQAANVMAQPDDAWCVDSGARLSPSEIGVAMIHGQNVSIGALFSVTIDAPGTGYAPGDIAEIADISGTGGVISLTVSGGQITGAAIFAAGANYVAPQITVRSPGGGSGAVLTVRVVSLFSLLFEGSPFSTANIGQIVRVRGGKGVVIAVPASNTLTVDFFDQPPATLANVPGQVIPRTEAGGWSIGSNVSTVGGLDHLNNTFVQVVADGNVQTPKLVVDGCVTLDEPASLITAGLGFTCQLQTMRLEVEQPTSQGKRKMMPHAHIRVRDTRGLVAGPSWDALVEVKERDNEPMGEPIRFQTGGGLPLPTLYPNAPVAPRPLWYPDKYLILEAAWDDDGVLCIQQSYPMPATVLAVIPAVVPGDT